MELRSLHYFVRIAELGSITRASAHLQIAQPALTRHVQRLEDELAGASDTARLSPSARALGQRLSAIEEELYQVRNRSFQDPLNFPPKLVERISGLIGLAGGADARPTAQTYAVFQMFAADLQKQLLAVREVLGRDLPSLNRGLRSASVAAIVPRAAELRPPAPERP